MVRTIAMICGLATLIFGLSLGGNELFRDRLRRQSLALSLFIGEDRIERRPTVETIHVLEDLLKREIGAENFNLRGFHRAELAFYEHDESRGTLRISGGTFNPGDPMIDRLFPPEQRTFDPNGKGIIASRELLNRLQFPRQLDEYGNAIPCNPPRTLRIRGTPDSPFVDVPVLAFTEIRLPLGHLFLVSEAEEQRLWSATTEGLASRVRSGSIPDDWPSYRELPRVVQDRCNKVGVELPREAFDLDGRRCWELVAKNDRPIIMSEWRKVLESLAEAMLLANDGAFDAPTGDFVSFQAINETKPHLDSSMEYIEISVRNLDDLKPASKVCRHKSVNFPADETTVDRLDEIARNSKLAIVVSGTLLVAVALNAFSGLTSLQMVRSEQKLPEIGMLRAMGLPQGRLHGVFLAAGFLFWIRGALYGTLLGIAASYTIGWLLLVDHKRPSEMLLVFDPIPIPVILFITLAATLLSVSVGTRQARRSSPMETLRAS